MMKYEIRNVKDALAYMVDCTLATVETMALKKSRPKAEYERQKSIAQTGVNFIIDLQVDPGTTRAADVFKAGYSVDKWVDQFEVPKK